MDAALLALLIEYTGRADASALLTTTLLLAARLAPLLLLSPWFLPSRSGPLLSASVLALLWLVLLPVAARAVLPRVAGVALLLAVVREVLIGGAFAFVARLPLEAVTAAGRLAARTSVEALPWMTPGHAPIATLYRWLGVVLFVVAGGPEAALNAVAEGLASLPLGHALPWTDPSAVTWTLVGWCAVAVAFGLVLAMPVAFGVLLVNVAEALAQRWFQDWPTSAPTSALASPLRHVVALGVVSLSLSFVASVLPGAFADSITYARLLWTGLTP